MKINKTQQDLVNSQASFQPAKEVIRLRIPGIDTLHTKPIEDIAATLALALKSNSNVLELRYCVGSHIELTIGHS